jgi:hypothetical protein
MWWAVEFGDWLFGYFFTSAADIAVSKAKRPPSARVLARAMRAAKDAVIDSAPDPRAREELAAAFRKLEFRKIKIVADAKTPPGEQVRRALLESLAPLTNPGKSGQSVIEEIGLSPGWLADQFVAAVTLVISQISSDQSSAALAGQMNATLVSDAVAGLSRDLRNWQAESARSGQAMHANAAVYFAGELSRLRRRVVQPSYELLGDVTGTTPDYVAAALSATAPLPDWNGFCEPLIAFCRDLAVQGRIVAEPDAELGSMQAWRNFWTLAEQGAAVVWAASPLPLPPAEPDGDQGQHAKKHADDGHAETRRRVLEGTGLVTTLGNIYPQYPLVQLWGIPMPICVFPAQPEERTEPESPLLKPLAEGNRIVPGPEEYSDAFDPAGLDQFRRNLARYENSTDKQRRSFFSGPTYALRRITRNEAGQIRIECGMGRYFLNHATSERLDPELMDALAHSPDKPVTLEELPRRAWLHRHAQDGDPVTDGTRRVAAMSHATVVMIACDDDDKCYDILLPARSGEVETHRGFNHVAPSGILAPFDEMSPSPQKEFSVRRNFYREWVEELYNATEHERPVGFAIPDPEEQPEITRLKAAHARLYYTGISVNLLTLRPEICLLLLINDPRWFDAERRLAEKMRLDFNWEYATEHDQLRIAADQPGHWRVRLNSDLQPWDGAKLKPTFLVPNAAAAIHLAINAVNDIHRIPLRDHDHLDADRVVGTARPRVPGRERRPVFLGGQRHQRVVDRAARDPDPAERRVHRPRLLGAQHQGHREPGVEQARRIVGREPGIARQPGENGIGLRERVRA